MALHQFKTKHYATNGKHRRPVSNSQGMSGCPHTDGEEEPDKTTLLNLPRKSTDPILLYKPTEVLTTSQPFRDDEEDLFSRCHNDLIRDMKLDYDASENYDQSGNLDNEYGHDDKDMYLEQRMEMPLEAPHGLSQISHTHHTHSEPRIASVFSWSTNQTEQREEYPSQRLHKVDLYDRSDSPTATLNETEPLNYSSQQPMDVKRLQHFYHQMATHMQAPMVCPVTGQQFPMHLLTASRRVHHSRGSHSRTLLRQSYPATDTSADPRNNEFENAKRMLVEGVRLVCDGARETMDKMESKNWMGAGDLGANPGMVGLHIPSPDDSCEDVGGKLNYIQTAFLQLAECNDPEILNEARRIIPVDLLHRLLRQVQEHSLEGQEPQGIT